MEKLALYLISPECAFNYFIQHNFLDVDCAKEVISKCLGYAIVVASCVVKVPQILKIVNAGNAEGVSFFSQFLDILTYSANLSYCFIAQYPFSAYGDSLFNFIQTVAIAHLCVMYAKKPAQAAGFSITCVFMLILLCSGVVPIRFLQLFNSLNIFVVICSRGSQIMTNLKNKSTGQLSIITMFLLFAGCLARIFTSIQETNDSQLVFSYSVGAFLNGVICLQILMYSNSQRVKTD